MIFFNEGIDTAEAKRIVKVVAPNGCEYLWMKYSSNQSIEFKVGFNYSPAAKPYVCEHCGKDFFDRCALKSHSLVHLDIRPFKCDICPKS